MTIVLNREQLLPALAKVVKVANKKQAMPNLSNCLVEVIDGKMQLTATDLEVEIRAVNQLDSGDDGEAFTLPAQNFIDICKALPSGSNIKITVDGGKAALQSARIHFKLSTLPAKDYPILGMPVVDGSFTVESGALKQIIESIKFSMAVQDVRYYLNGLLLDIARKRPNESCLLSCVATDGHRLAVNETGILVDGNERKLILPRKAVTELMRLLDNSDQLVTVEFGNGFCCFKISDAVLTTKLIDGKYPDYRSIMPRHLDRTASIDRISLRDALTRAALLSDMRYKGVRLSFQPGCLTLESSTTTTGQDGHKEDIDAKYDNDEVSIGFNVEYLIDVITSLTGEKVVIDFTKPIDNNLSSVMIHDPDNNNLSHIVMPMRL